MSCLWKPLSLALKPVNKRARAVPHRFLARFRVEELEPRTLLSVYTPAQIVHAYGFDAIPFLKSNGNFNAYTQNAGRGQTIAIVDAYYDPTIASDLASFSAKFNLPQLDGKGADGKFTAVDLSHKTLSPAGDDWTIETALDVEWAHAIAPRANIVLVQAASDNSDSTGAPIDLLNAVQYAATTAGAQVVSMSWGQSELPAETSWDRYFTTNLSTGKPLSGVTFVAASGDSGAGTIWPAVSPNVVAVGGTTLKLTASNTISSETGWGNGWASWYFGGSGGGFSSYEPLPSFQSGITTGGGGFKYTSFGVRLSPDVAYAADPNTGFYVLDGADGGWYVVGGTSAGAPQFSALFALANQQAGAPLSSSQALKALYAAPSADFHDVTSGSTGAYNIYNNYGQVIGQIPVTAAPGYDLVTGLGSPRANLLVPYLATVVTPAAKVNPLATSGSTGSHGSGTGKGTQHFVLLANTGIAGPLGGQGGSVIGVFHGLSGVQTGTVPTGFYGMQAIQAGSAPTAPLTPPAGTPPPVPLAVHSSRILGTDIGGGFALSLDSQPRAGRPAGFLPQDVPALPPLPPAPEEKKAAPAQATRIELGQHANVPGLWGDQTPEALALASAAVGAGLQREPFVAIWGLAVALALQHLDQKVQATGYEGRRPGIAGLSK